MSVLLPDIYKYAYQDNTSNQWHRSAASIMSTSSLNQSDIPNYSATPGTEISSEELKICSTLYNDNYGVWAPHCQAVRGKSVVPGKPPSNEAPVMTDGGRSCLSQVAESDSSRRGSSKSFSAIPIARYWSLAVY